MEEANYLGALAPEAMNLSGEIYQLAWLIKSLNLQSEDLITIDESITFYPCNGIMQEGSENSPQFGRTVSDAFFYCTGTQLEFVLNNSERIRYIKTPGYKDRFTLTKALGVYSQANEQMANGVEIPLRFLWLLDAMVNSVAVITPNPRGESYPPMRMRWSTLRESRRINIGLYPSWDTWHDYSAYLGFPVNFGSETILVDSNTIELAYFMFDTFFNGDSSAIQVLRCELSRLELARDHIKMVVSKIDDDMSNKQLETVNWNTFVETSQFGSFLCSGNRRSAFKEDLGITSRN
jgi:hypothetical protein